MGAGGTEERPPDEGRPWRSHGNRCAGDEAEGMGLVNYEDQKVTPKSVQEG